MLDLQADRTTVLTNAKSLLAAAKSGNRELTDAEQATMTGYMARVGELDKQIKGRALVNSVMSLGSSEDHLVDRGGLFTDAAKAGIIQAVKTRTAYRTELDIGGTKAALTSGTLLPTSGTTVEGGLHPNAQFPLASLFGNQPATGPSQRYYRTTAGVAAVVAEATQKPDAGVSFDAVDLLLSKLACTAQFSSEMEEDAPFLISYLQHELIAAIIAAENKLIVDTFAATSGVLSATGAGTTIIDLISDALAAQEAISGTTPSAIVAHPSVIATIRKAKAATAGSYMVDPLSASPSMLHGVRLVSTPAVAPANVWVVCGIGTTIFRRGPVTAEIGLNGTDLTFNTRTMVAEERLAVAVTRPSSLSKLVLT